MIKQIPFFIFLCLVLSCESTIKERDKNQNITSVDMLKLDKEEHIKLRQNILKKIRFDFSANRVNSFKGSIEIKASLYNDYSDTVYFLSSTCDGMQYSLRYDTCKFVLKPFMYCNASFPLILKIAPKGKYEFNTHFDFKKKESKIKLGFDFYKVDKSIDLDKVSLSEIHYRPENEQIIVWAEEN